MTDLALINTLNATRSNMATSGLLNREVESSPQGASFATTLQQQIRSQPAANATPTKESQAPTESTAKPSASNESKTESNGTQTAEKATSSAGTSPGNTQDSQEASKEVAATPAPVTDAINALLPLLPALNQVASGKSSSNPLSEQSSEKKGNETQDPTLIAAMLTPAGTQSNPVVQTPTEPRSPASNAADVLAETAANSAAPAMIATAETSLGAGAAGSKAELTADSGPSFQATLLAQQSGVSTPVTAVQNTTSSASVNNTLTQKVGSEHWNQALGDHLVWMSSEKQSKAELVLNPPQMGRVEISLTVSGDQASANFVSAHPQVREALENALPRLKEVLADAGIQLGQAQVGSEPSSQSSQQQETRHNSGNGQGNGPNFFGQSVEASDSRLTATSLPGLKAGNGLVDAFA